MILAELHAWTQQVHCPRHLFPKHQTRFKILSTHQGFPVVSAPFVTSRSISSEHRRPFRSTLRATEVTASESSGLRRFDFLAGRNGESISFVCKVVCGDGTQQITSLDTFSINYIPLQCYIEIRSHTTITMIFGLIFVANRFLQLGSEAGVPPELGHLWYQQSSAMSCTRRPLVCCETCYSFGFNWKHLLRL